jgi:uncharacterized RDD family membrane protein YckC
MLFKTEITRALRLGAMVIDHLVMCFISMAIAFGFLIVGFFQKNAGITHEQNVFDPHLMAYGLVLGFLLYINKDFFSGQSPAKNMLKIQVVNHKTNEVASGLRCFIRNLTIPLWPIEVVFTLANPERRLGDYLAGTRIDSIDFERMSKPASLNDIFSVGVFTVMLGLLFVKVFPFESFKSEQIHYVESSYNEAFSQDLSWFLADRFQYDCDSVSVKYYGAIEKDSLSYISVLFFTSKQEVVDRVYGGAGFGKLIKDTLSLMLAPESFVVKGKLILLRPGQVKISEFLNFPVGRLSKEAVDNGFVNDSTRVIRGYYEGGEPESETTYVNGQLYGTYKEWYENGSLKTEGVYRDGQRNGVTTTWYQNGSKESELLYQNNRMVRIIARYDKNGRKVSPASDD